LEAVLGQALERYNFAAASAAGKPSMEAMANLRLINDLVRISAGHLGTGAPVPRLTQNKENLLETVSGAASSANPSEHHVLAMEILGYLTL